MAIREILKEPNIILRQISTPVDTVTDEIRTLMDDMLDTMYDAPGIGLAAIQIGVPKRIIVIDLNSAEDDRKPAPLYFVNPVITVINPELYIYKEGCLSVPEINENVSRPTEISVSYLDYDGNPQILQTDGLLATCLQHEMDHLEGILFIDRLSKFKRQLALQKLRKLNKLKLS